MSISLVIPGPVNIFLKGGAHLSGRPLGRATELGLSTEEVRVTYHFHHRDVKITGMGDDVPGDIQSQLASAEIAAKLLCFDTAVLDVAVDESIVGGGLLDLISRDPFNLPFSTTASGGMVGILGPAGTLLGNRRQMYESGNRMFSVNLVCGEEQFSLAANPLADPPFPSYRFRQCYMYQRPLVTRLGAKVLEAEVNFRALPYSDPLRSGIYSGLLGNLGNEASLPFVVFQSGAAHMRRREVLMSGAILWDRTIDVG